MPDEIRGIAEPEDIVSQDDAARILGIDLPATRDEVEDAFRDITTEAHPDTGGTTALFQAVTLARDALLGEARLDPEGGRAPEDSARGRDVSVGGETTAGGGARTGTPSDDFDFGDQAEETDDDFGGFDDSAGGAGGAGFSMGEVEKIRRDVKQKLMEGLTEQQLKQRFGGVATFDNVADLLTKFILQGSIDLGDIDKLITGGTRTGGTSEATGGNFGDAGGSDFFGSGSDFFSSDPNDFKVSPENVGDGDDDE